MTNLSDNRLVKTFTELRAAGGKTLLPFITAGFPDLDFTKALLEDFHGRGVRVCELGIPFSDPVADGPVIQASYTQALQAGITVRAIFDTVARYRRDEARRCPPAGQRPPLALVAMISYSIVFRHGVEKFLDEAVAAGIDGLIIPDLPLDEAQPMESAAAKKGVANILLIAPTTPPDRRYEIARHSRGFLYYISIAGITGERARLPEATIAGVAELRKHTETPICVGFGVSNPATVAEVCQVADGAIVGSAIVHRIADAAKSSLPRAAMVQKVGEFISELLAPIKK